MTLYDTTKRAGLLDDLLTLSAAARMLGVSIGTLRGYIERGELPAQNIGGEGRAVRWMVHHADVEAFGWPEMGRSRKEPTMAQLRIFSNGGGVQSTAALVLSAQGKIDYPIHVFANVGDKAEHPASLEYVRNVAMPFAAANGIEFVEVQHTWQRGERAGTKGDLYDDVLAPPSPAAMYLPMYADNGAPGIRACTAQYKIRVVSHFLRKRGVKKDNPAIVGLGISLDEFQRMRTDSGEDTQQLAYPLIDLRITRDQCETIIRDAGLPVPPKSSCWFCPFHSLATWARMKQEEPELFARAVDLEVKVNEIRKRREKPLLWLTTKARPLDQVVGDQSLLDFGDDDDEAGGCVSGFCLT